MGSVRRFRFGVVGSVVGLAVLMANALVPTVSSASGTWTQVGGTITAASSSYFGIATSMSSDGMRVAVADRNADSNRGKVRVYDDVAGTWTQVGNTINGIAYSDEFGSAVALSNDGSRLAVLATRRVDAGATDAGSVRVFDLVGNTWTQVGQEIFGSARYAYLNSVALSADGMRIVVGQTGPASKGMVRVFDLVSGTWTQVGNSIEGTNSYPDGDFYGASVDITADGSRIAVGAPGQSGSGVGKVQVLDLVGSTWTQVGSDISGVGAHDAMGRIVSLSADGSRVLVVAGIIAEVSVLELVNGQWTQLGDVLSGYRGAIASDGLRIAVSGPKPTASDPAVGSVYDWIDGAWAQAGADIPGTAGSQSWGSMAISGLGYRIVDGQYGAGGGGNVLVFEQQRPTVTISFDANGGSGGPAPISGDARSTIVLPSDVPTLSGSTFDGWEVVGTSTVLQPGATFAVPPDGSVVLRAKWSVDPNGGSSNGGAAAPVFTG